MKIMGIDASTSCTGYSVFEDGELVAYGAIYPDHKTGIKWRGKLIEIGAKFKDLLKEHQPDKIYMEDVPLINKQMETLVILGAVQGYFLGFIQAFDIPVEFLQASTWRRKVGTYDGTREGMKRDRQKEKAIEIANNIFDLELRWVSPKSTKNQDDIAEAILIAYSQLFDKGE